MKHVPKIKLALLAASLLGASTSCFAEGGVGTGGGIGILCNGKLQTLDVYEGEHVRNLKALPDQGTLNKNLKFYLDAFAQKSRAAAPTPAGGKPMMDSLRTLLKEKVQYVDENLAYSSDATLPDLKPGCKAVQIAQQTGDQSVFSSVYFKKLKIKINKKYFNMLSPRDQAALIVHELVYALRRSGGDAITSDDTRKNVVSLFFEGSEPLLKDIWEAPVYQQCWSKYQVAVPAAGYSTQQRKSTGWYVSESSQNGVKGLLFNFNRIGGEELASRTTMFVPGLTLKEYKDGTTPVRGEITQKFDGRSWKFKTAPAEYGSFNKDVISDDQKWMQLEVTAGGEDKKLNKEVVYGRCIAIGKDDESMDFVKVRARHRQVESSVREEDSSTVDAE